MDDLLKSYQVLRLTPGAPLEEAKQAYRNAAWLWHPDRFPRESYIQERAQKKIREINAAYERIRAHFAGLEEGPGEAAAKDSEIPGVDGPAPDDAAIASGPRPEDAPPPAWTWRTWLQEHGARLAVGLALVAGLLISPLIFYYLGSPAAPGPAGVQEPPLVPQVSPATTAATPPPAPGASPAPAAGPAPLAKPAPGPAPIPPQFFTLGATQDKVRAIQGTPSSITGNTWKYGLSTVTFKNQRLVSYQNISRNLKVRLLPKSAAPGQPPVFFTVGSTKDRVLAVQGTPSGVVGNTWKFGESEVHFQGDRVVSFADSGHNLQVKKWAKTRAARKSRPGYFTLGSSKRRVLYVQGSPHYASGNTWWYGYSRVHFHRDRVVAVADHSRVLRVRVF
jgi:hypothetical protein